MTCAHCSLPLTPPSVRSRVLEGEFHEVCYGAAWKLKDVMAQQDEGWQVDAWSSGVGVHAGENGAIIPVEGESMARAAELADNLSE